MRRSRKRKSDRAWSFCFPISKFSNFRFKRLGLSSLCVAGSLRLRCMRTMACCCTTTPRLATAAASSCTAHRTASPNRTPWRHRCGGNHSRKMSLSRKLPPLPPLFLPLCLAWRQCCMIRCWERSPLKGCKRGPKIRRTLLRSGDHSFTRALLLTPFPLQRPINASTPLGCLLPNRLLAFAGFGAAPGAEAEQQGQELRRKLQSYVRQAVSGDALLLLFVRRFPFPARSLCFVSILSTSVLQRKRRRPVQVPPGQ